MLVVVAVVVAFVLRRRGEDAPTQGASWAVPTQLDRADFTRPDAPWLVAVFSSATCLSCEATWAKAGQLASDAVAVQEVEAAADRDLHHRYGVEAVPMVLVADANRRGAGVVPRRADGHRPLGDAGRAARARFDARRLRRTA